MSDAAVALLAGAAVNIVGMIIAYLKLKNGIEGKIDDNTKLTKAGTTAAADAKKAAAETKSVVLQKLNGGIDDAVATITTELREHSASDERNMKAIDAKFGDLTEYVHKRNHDLLEVLGILSNKVELLLPPDAKEA